jgi:hypothetical protein
MQGLFGYGLSNLSVKLLILGAKISRSFHINFSHIIIISQQTHRQLPLAAGLKKLAFMFQNNYVS